MQRLNYVKLDVAYCCWLRLSLKSSPKKGKLEAGQDEREMDGRNNAISIFRNVFFKEIFYLTRDHFIDISRCTSTAAVSLNSREREKRNGENRFLLPFSSEK